MYSIHQEFEDLTSAIELVHDLFGRLESSISTSSPDLEDTVYFLKLAVHEWISNLIQHARFENRKPRVAFKISTNGSSLLCVIEDNSSGFDLPGQLQVQENKFRADYPPERGMGLLIVNALAQNLTYTAISDSQHRLEFHVDADHKPCMNTLF